VSVDDITITIGHKMRKARKLRNITLKELAERTGISSSMLSQVERGLASPTIVSLVTVANALSLPPAFFFEDNIPMENGEQNPIFKKEHKNILHTETGMTLIPLATATDLEDHTIQLAEIYLEPGACNRNNPVSHDGLEKIAVLEGSIEVEIGYKKYLLGAGECIKVNTTLPHRLINLGSEKAHCIWLIITTRVP